MANKKKSSVDESEYPLAAKSLREVIAEWKRQRRELFQKLKTESNMTYDQIAERYGITRQYASQLTKEEK